MNVVSPEAIGLIFNLLSPSHRDELLDLLKDLAEQQKESPLRPNWLLKCRWT